MVSINDLATAAIASSSPDKRGAFIVLEGLDHSGKTTKQIYALLAAGTTIIYDRFYYSSIARAPDRGLLCLDVVLFLDLNEARAKARGG
ncbi:Thymidylate kinase [Tolypocladium paradoxum]|uniref:Thymidylate kinase n=1 Tax=Tolypocladium paradoxum TaxID=94208 RepID=A0A2S4L1M6_9HYPO|nr:Thymidylate kinase [Tolypocladium paradoxum]